MEPEDLIGWILTTFECISKDMADIVTLDDFKNASAVLIDLSNTYSYLCTLLSYAKVYVRKAKRELTKIEQENMIDRRDIIQGMVESVKHKYNGVSRAVTIYIENANELKMMGSK